VLGKIPPTEINERGEDRLLNERPRIKGGRNFSYGWGEGGEPLEAANPFSQKVGGGRKKGKRQEATFTQIHQVRPDKQYGGLKKKYPGWRGSIRKLWGRRRSRGGENKTPDKILVDERQKEKGFRGPGWANHYFTIQSLGEERDKKEKKGGYVLAGKKIWDGRGRKRYLVSAPQKERGGEGGDKGGESIGVKKHNSARKKEKNSQRGLA